MRTFAKWYVLTAAAIAPAAGLAQGTLSTQGFGYPTGQMSTRALGAGGATAEIDPLSGSNPASLLNFGGSVLYFQAEPEYRTLHINGASEKTSVARYPLVVAAFPVTTNVIAGLTISNLLDRSFQTQVRGGARVADSTFNVNNIFKSDGAIADIRLGAAWSPRTWLKLGVGAHAITGDNRIASSQVFDDSTRFAPLIDTATVGYEGTALSGGFELAAPHDIVLTGAYRRGGAMSLLRGDSTVSRAHVPDHVGFAINYMGIRGSSLGVRTAHDTWSNMRGLGSSNVRISDSWDTSIGADVLGPKVSSHIVQIRGGYRWRTLPFGFATSNVTERTASLGLGTLASRGRIAFDFAALRASRSAGASLSENAWTYSFGVTVRP